MPTQPQMKKYVVAIRTTMTTLYTVYAEGDDAAKKMANKRMQEGMIAPDAPPRITQKATEIIRMEDKPISVAATPRA